MTELSSAMLSLSILSSSSHFFFFPFPPLLLWGGVGPTYFLLGVGGFSPIMKIELEQSGALVVFHDTPTSLLDALGPAPPWEKQRERVTEGNRLESDYPTQIGHFEETAL